MKKSELKEGMKVRNTLSNSIGEVLNPNDCTAGYVSIRRRIAAGIKKGKYTYPIWNVGYLVKVD